MERTTLYPIKPGCFRPRKDGISIIHIQYCFTGRKKLLLDTGIEIPLKYWDKLNLKVNRDIPPEYGGAKKINDLLNAQLNLVADIIKYAEKRNISDKDKFVKKYYKPDLDIYSLDELVKKDEQERVILEVEKKKTELDVYDRTTEPKALLYLCINCNCCRVAGFARDLRNTIVNLIGVKIIELFHQAVTSIGMVLIIFLLLKN